VRKKLFSIAIIMCMFLGTTQAVSAASAGGVSENPGKRASSTSFKDLKSSHWAYSFINNLTEKGIISGFPDSTFKPEGTMTRAAFAKIVVLAFNIPVSTATISSFKDIPGDYWALKYIEAAKSAGIIDGFSDGTFKPENMVSRAQIAKMVIVGGKFKINKTGTPFSDMISHWAYNYIMTAKNLGIIGDYANGKFAPAKGATRAEAAKIMATSLIAVLGEQTPNPDLPKITITSPTDKDEFRTSNDSIQLSGTASDDKEVVRVTWSNSRGGEGTAQGTTNWMVPGITLKEGANLITATVKDNGGNTATDTVKITYTPASGGGGGSTPNSNADITSVFTASAPTVDGILSPGEWPDPVKSKTLTYRDDATPTPHEESHQMDVYFKNDDTYLYVAVKITGDDFEAAGYQPTGDMDVLDVAFDNNNNGQVDSNEDDKHFWNLEYVDSHAIDTNQWQVDDQPSDTIGHATHSAPDASGDYIYELKIPLKFSNIQNLNIRPGNIVGVCIKFEEWHYADGFLGSRGDWSNASWPSFTGSMKFGKLKLASQ